MNLYLDLFLTFAKVGYVPLAVATPCCPSSSGRWWRKKGWVTEEEVTDYFAIGQCTPGIIAVNTSVFIGHRQRGGPRRNCRRPGSGVSQLCGHHHHSRIPHKICDLSGGSARPGGHQCRSGGTDCSQRAQAGKDKFEGETRSMHLFGSSGAGRAVRAAGCGPGHPAGSGAGSPLQSCIPCGGSRSDRLAAGPGEAPIPRR